MPFADANGQRLYYDERGSGEPLILVMGLGADHLSWGLQMPAFSERHRTIRFDNRDIGRSAPVEEDYTLADLAADTLALADALGAERFHLCGLSLGGAIAQHVALAAPDRVRTLTLMATWAGAGRRYAEARVRNWEREVRSASREEFLDTMLLLTMSERFFEQPEAVENMRRLLLSHPYPQTPESFLRQARASSHHDLRDRLGELAMPVLVISAEHDILVPPWKQTELASLIPGARLTTIPGAPHAVNIEAAEQVNEAVLKFLSPASESQAPRFGDVTSA